MSARVARIRVHRVDVPLLRPFVTAVRRTDHVPAVLVEVVDSDGRSGWGEAAASWRVTGESPAGIAAAVLGPVRDAVLGLPVDDPQVWGKAVRRSVVGNAAARSAVDCALWDLAAQVAGQPLTGPSRLGGPSTVETDMTLSAGAPEELLARAREHVGRGSGPSRSRSAAPSRTRRRWCCCGASWATTWCCGSTPTRRGASSRPWP